MLVHLDLNQRIDIVLCTTASTQQGQRKEGRNEGRDKDMKEILIKLYKASLDTTVLIIYHQRHVSAL